VLTKQWDIILEITEPSITGGYTKGKY